MWDFMLCVHCEMEGLAHFTLASLLAHQRGCNCQMCTRVRLGIIGSI